MTTPIHTDPTTGMKYTWDGAQWQPLPVQPAKKPSRRWLYISLAAGAVLIVGTAAGAASSGDKKKAAAPIATSSHATSSVAPSTTPPDISTESGVNPTPEVFPSPDGTYTGTCDYELSTDFDNYETHAADLNGEVDVENTGNVGIVIKVAIAWPQLGHAPIAMHKTVKVPYGKTVTARFTQPIGQSEIDRLQSWQEGHDFKDGCTYHGTVLDTFGKVH
jgi:hypothetical protein